MDSGARSPIMRTTRYSVPRCTCITVIGSCRRTIRGVVNLRSAQHRFPGSRLKITPLPCPSASYLLGGDTAVPIRASYADEGLSGGKGGVRVWDSGIGSWPEWLSPWQGCSCSFLSARGGIGGDEQGRNAKYLMPSNAVSTIPKPPDETYNKEQNRPRKTTRQYVILRGVPRQPDLRGERSVDQRWRNSRSQVRSAGSVSRVVCHRAGRRSQGQGNARLGDPPGFPFEKRKMTLEARTPFAPSSLSNRGRRTTLKT
jgi:hypothetical protein